MIFTSLAIVQVGLVFYARSVAMAAATQGVNAGRGYNAPAGTAQAAAARFLDRAGDGLAGQDVKVTQTGTDVWATVSGDAISVLPGITFRISQTAHGSVEQPS